MKMLEKKKSNISDVRINPIQNPIRDPQIFIRLYFILIGIKTVSASIILFLRVTLSCERVLKNINLVEKSQREQSEKSKLMLKKFPKSVDLFDFMEKL